LKGLPANESFLLVFLLRALLRGNQHNKVFLVESVKSDVLTYVGTVKSSQSNSEPRKKGLPHTPHDFPRTPS